MAKKLSITVLLLMVMITAPAAEDFSFTFEWGDIPLCTSGNPKIVPNPKFVLSNVPEGTKFIEFIMTDLDVPTYDHGGGTVKYTGENVIEPGAFEYASPCPPHGAHRYEWTAKAKKKTGFFSGFLGKANSMKTYP